MISASAYRDTTASKKAMPAESNPAATLSAIPIWAAPSKPDPTAGKTLRVWHFFSILAYSTYCYAADLLQDRVAEYDEEQGLLLHQYLRPLRRTDLLHADCRLPPQRM